MNKIIIIGGEGTAVNIAEAIDDAINNYGYKAQLLGFANDNIGKGKIYKYDIITKITEIEKYYVYDDVKLIFALFKPGFMVERTKLLNSLSIPKKNQVNFIHPSCYLSQSNNMGVGNIILQNSSIQNNIFLGDNNIISSNVVIEHDTRIENNNFFAAGTIIGSNVRIRNSSFFGLNSSIRENLIVNNGTFLGMGSVLLNDMNENEVWYGVPAKKK
jgi:sugar O-acyltransferase (sialic acid O-acetyltransferase NeuD family)